ncbi:tetratricopeptide repeat protein [Caldilinea sp.]|uniref:tetratricopeptide repeat protein n=1 Tax=Caldilinea sp. TaxID=2293560 RepID=UPI002B812388|nr:tetratricopeptide repeat protein [Caldilinea sp.]
MSVISIRERGLSQPGPVVSIDGQEHPIVVPDPFSPAEERRLEWYFEEHLRYPFLESVAANEAAASVRVYGEALFAAIFTGAAYGPYYAARLRGVEHITFEITGSPAWHARHWEALWDPALPEPLAVQATFVRRNLTPQPAPALPDPAPTLRLLLVTARPGGARDVGYRTISRPLLEMVRGADLPVEIELLRPGTYRSLEEHLERRGAGYYHIVHFDVHGALLSYQQFEQVEQRRTQEHLTYQPGVAFQPDRYGRPHLPAYAGVKAFLFLEDEHGPQPDPVEAKELAGLLTRHRVPIVVLNACQSGKQMPAPGANRRDAGANPDSQPLPAVETSLGSQLMAAGCQTVLAMGYSVTVSAAVLLMRELYRNLFGREALSVAIRRGRRALYLDKQRRAYYNQRIELEDWLLPVVYEDRDRPLPLRDFNAAESSAFYNRRAAGYKPPPLAYEFVGRDLDVLQIEKALLMRRNLLLVRGMGGAGKTTLLHHLAWWWWETGLVEQVFYFGYDTRAWTRQQLLDAIARQVLGEGDYRGHFQPLGLDAQQAYLAQRLRARRHLLILDNLESITGADLAIQHTLPAAEQDALAAFLAELAGGRTLVLLGSRGAETWLAPHTFAENVYTLGGLDAEAASSLADLILRRHHAEAHRKDSDLARLIKLLDGYPLALEVVLANLAHETPAQVLAALLAGDVALDAAASSGDKTQSILRCIDYAFGNLDAGSQALLRCLAPFTGVVNLNWLEQYTVQLRAQPALANLPYDRWPEVLQQAADWGLLGGHEVQGYVRLQPTLAYFLRAGTTASDEQKEARNEAFRLHYEQVGIALERLMQSRKAEEKQRSQALAHLEYENLYCAMEMGLTRKTDFYYQFSALFEFLLARQDGSRRLALCRTVASFRETYDSQQLQGEIGADFYKALARLGVTLLDMKRYSESERTHLDIVDLLSGLESLAPELRGQWTAINYHQLGMVAQAQRQWAQAEQYYRQALDLFIEFNDRYSQAGTYHQLGMVAQEQRQWAQAEQYSRQALDLFIEFNDRYSQASTYHQLGRVAQAQRQWAQALQYLLKDLEISTEFKDDYGVGITLRSLARLHRESGDASVLAATAQVLGVSAAEVAALFAGALEE